MRTLAGAFVALLVLWAGSAWASHRPNNEVHIGGAISQTGRYAEPAGRQVNSIKLWVDEVNARGGLLGHKVDLSLLDDKSDTQTAIKLYEKLITEDKVDLVLGPYSSGITEAVSNVTERYKMPFVAYGAAASTIWEKGRRYIFNIVAVAEDYRKGAVHLAKQIGVKTAAIIGEDSLFPRQSARAPRTGPRSSASRSSSTRTIRSSRPTSPPCSRRSTARAPRPSSPTATSPTPPPSSARCAS